MCFSEGTSKTTKNQLEMKRNNLLFASVALVLSASAIQAQDSSALVDALVRKKILTAQEGENIRADLIRENASTNAGKLQLSNSVTSLKLYGDVRLRYQYDNKDPQVQTAAFLSDLETETVYVNGKATTAYIKGDTKVVDPTTGKVIKGQLKQGKGGLGSDQSGSQNSRERIRLRLNGDFELAGGFFGGVQLQTSQAADSGNQTLGDSTNGASGFGNYNIYISRAFVGWNATDWLTLVGGKQANPFYTTDLVWGPDVNPDGFVEKVDLFKLFGGNDEVVSNTVDGKKATSVSISRAENPFALSLVAGQFVFADNNEDLVGADYKTDTWLFATQLVGSARLAKGVKVTLAPGFLTYTAGNVGAASNTVPFTGGVSEYQYSANSLLHTAHTQAATRDLSVITAPGDVSFKLFGLKTKVLWDFAYNTEGQRRVEEIYGLQDIQIPVTNSKGVVTGYKNTHGTVTKDTLVSTTRVSGHSSRDDIAWLLGLQIGENKKTGDWSLLANFRQTGIGAVDPNINDPNFALGYLNTQGIKASLAYNFTNFIVGAITYYDAWNLRDDLVGGQATSGQKIAAINGAQVLQVDLNVKF